MCIRDSFYNAAEPVKEYVRTALNEEVEAAGLEVTETTDYETLTIALVMDGNTLIADNSSENYSQGAYIQIFTREGYAAVTGYQAGELGEHEVAVYVQDGMLPESFNLMGEDYTLSHCHGISQICFPVSCLPRLPPERKPHRCHPHNPMTD